MITMVLLLKCLQNRTYSLNNSAKDHLVCTFILLFAIHILEQNLHSHACRFTGLVLLLQWKQLLLLLVLRALVVDMT